MIAAAFKLVVLLTSLTVFSICANSPAIAQASKDTRETAKPADTVSPYGVSYPSGSFTYSVPLFSIGHGEWPNRIDVSLNYDSSGGRNPNSLWTISVQRRVSAQYAQFVTGFEGAPIGEAHQFAINVVLGNTTQTFELGDYTLSSSNFISVGNDGNTLEFVEGAGGAPDGFYYKHGEFTTTGSDGTEIKFTGGMPNYADGPLVISSGSRVKFPNGFVIKYSQPETGSGVTFPLSSSNGLIVRQFGNQICAFNTALIDSTAITSCASSLVTATLTSTSFPTGGIGITSVTRPDGSTYTFEYQSYYSRYVSTNGQAYSERTRYHLSCAKEPGQSTCAVRNTYDACDGPGFVFYNPEYFGSGSYVEEDSEWTGSRDRVISQTFADGRAVSYSYNGAAAGQGAGCRKIFSVTMTEAGASTVFQLGGQPLNIEQATTVSDVTDPLQRTSAYAWTGSNAAATYLGRNHLLASTTGPDGRMIEYTYDSRGNLITTRAKARPGSGDTDIVSSASFPSTCPNAKTCNQPTSVTDARGNTTTYTYDPAHGGVLTITRPAVGGVAPVTRNYYVQREPWLRSGGGYAKTGESIWLKSEDRSCRNSTLDPVAGTCSAGAGDLVRTLYDYGPDVGPNNLWLRGVAVEADGQTLRTCYQYDHLGRQIAETKPLGTGATCP